MIKLNTTYLTGIIAALSPVILSGCADDLLFDDPANFASGEYVTFSAEVSAAAARETRGAKELYSPLELESESGEFPLYLHTYEHAAGDDWQSDAPTTRGVQINTAQGLYDIHGSFGVRAMKSETRSEYIELQETRLVSNDDYKIWTTRSAMRWPGNERLSFNAIAPYGEETEMSELSYGENSISFTYSAKKGNGTNDAEKQKDLMMAVANLTKEETSDFSHRVPLKFHHALSAVKFAVRDVLKGRVVSIAIKGVNGTGDCVFTADNDSRNGSFDWTGQRDVTDYKQLFNVEIENGNFTTADEDHDVELTQKGNMPEKTFMLVPQVIPDDATIEVVIERDNVVEGLQKTITVRGKIKANNVTQWLAGHEYVYTISTSKDNWVNVLEATGNHLSRTEAHNVDGDQIYVYSPSFTEWDTYGNNAYFKVKSYRYKANDHTHIEPLPWTASHEGSLSYNIDGGIDAAYPVANPQQKWVNAADWIKDTTTPSAPLSGAGTSTTTANELHNIEMKAHFVSTDWPGDELMQGYKPYTGYSEANPYDLSTFGNAVPQSTANCYVIDRGGWYMFPLVYGNAITNGKTNEKAYKSQCTSTDTDLKLLSTMTDYNGNDISQPEIMNVPANATAELVWQDAYDMVDKIQLVTIGGRKMIRFYVDSNSLQQGNAVIALKDGSGLIMWSWHIWATEHWLDPITRKPHVFDPTNSRFNTFTPNNKTNMRERGDVEVTYNQKGRSFMMAPYNVGWCDPKKVLYLKRKGEMVVTQKGSGKTVSIEIIQAGDVIDYKYANNTYYQWGRKDPMRGYFNHEHSTKRTFGPAATQPQFTYHEKLSSMSIKVTIERSIQCPYEFYVSKTGNSTSPYQDWLTTNFRSNLWNNHEDLGMEIFDDNDDHADMWSHTKTVYDPSPAGYMVPNAGVWHVVQKNWSDAYTDKDGNVYTTTYVNKEDGDRYGDKDFKIPVTKRDKWAGGNWNVTTFANKVNGALVDEYNYKVWAKGNAGVDAEALFFSSTGNRWWTDGWKPNGIRAGGNFGRNVSYAWSNRSYHARNSDKVVTSSYNAYGMALGLDTDREVEGNNAELRYYVGGQFIGRRAMGRPVRAIREP